jgi:hypothetical protein
MARQRRSFAPATSYHVTMRCNNQAFDLRQAAHSCGSCCRDKRSPGSCRRYRPEPKKPSWPRWGGWRLWREISGKSARGRGGDQADLRTSDDVRSCACPYRKPKAADGRRRIGR